MENEKFCHRWNKKFAIPCAVQHTLLKKKNKKKNLQHNLTVVSRSQSAAAARGLECAIWRRLPPAWRSRCASRTAWWPAECRRWWRPSRWSPAACPPPPELGRLWSGYCQTSRGNKGDLVLKGAQIEKQLQVPPELPPPPNTFWLAESSCKPK